MSIWSKVSPWIDRDYYAFTTLTILVSIVMISHFVTREKIWSENDIVKIEGKFSNYSFNHGSGGRRMYYFWLKEFHCTFKIPADYHDSFNRNGFVTNTKRNDNLKLYISKKQLVNLNSDKKIFVQHIEKEKLVFLDKRDSLEKESGFGEVYTGVGFFLAGLFYYRIRTTIWKPKTKN